jgi:hypothetical protein
MTMGSVSRTDRCTRFIREFGTDYVQKLGLGIGRRLVVVAEGLVFDKREEVVRYEVVVRPEGTEEEIRFMLDPAFCAPDDPAEDQIAQVADDLELDADVVRRRLETPGLRRRGR